LKKAPNVNNHPTGEKLAFFLNTNVMINFFSKFSFALRQKRRFFGKIFRQKYFKNHNIDPNLVTLLSLPFFRSGKLSSK
jgi:hypothetical protein